MKEAINSVRHFDNEACLQFRLDDDDAVGVRFVARLRQTGLQFQAFSSENRCVAIDFNTGVIARPHAKGIDSEDVIRQYWTSALGMMIAPKAKISIMNFGHTPESLCLAASQASAGIAFQTVQTAVQGVRDHRARCAHALPRSWKG